MKFLKVCGSQVSFHPRIDEFQISGSGRAVTSNSLTAGIGSPRVIGDKSLVQFR
jgi:hypothetical protein